MLSFNNYLNIILSFYYSFICLVMFADVIRPHNWGGGGGVAIFLLNINPPPTTKINKSRRLCGHYEHYTVDRLTSTKKITSMNFREIYSFIDTARLACDILIRFSRYQHFFHRVSKMFSNFRTFKHL